MRSIWEICEELSAFIGGERGNKETRGQGRRNIYI